MKALWNRSCFDVRDVAPYRNDGVSYFATVKHQEVEQYCYTAPHDDDALFAVSLLCRSRSWSGDWHRRDNPRFLTVTYVHAGECAVRVNDECLIAEAGDIFFLPPGASTEFATIGSCLKSAALISRDGIELFRGRLPLCRPSAGNGVWERFYNGALRRLGNTDQPAARQEISELCFSLLQGFCMHAEVQLPPHLKQLLTYMNQHLAEALPLSQLAQAAGVSPATLTRLFRVHLQTSPHQYLVEQRMRRARQLLADHILSIKEIAAETGYPNSANFSTEFRKSTGVSPKEYGKLNY